MADVDSSSTPDDTPADTPDAVGGDEAVPANRAARRAHKRSGATPQAANGPADTIRTTPARTQRQWASRRSG
jgi:hypothetical protein